MIVETILERLASLERRYEELSQMMAAPEVATDHSRLQALAREQAALEERVALYREYRRVQQELEEARPLAQGEDLDLAALARSEVALLEERRERLWEQLRRALLPKDEHEDRAVFIEVRAGTGGEEASLFAAVLLRMYLRYAQDHGWRSDLVSSHQTGLGGFKEVILEVEGRGAYGRLRWESGVHRVQRVPTTEASGRIHTSTATVAVLPEADEVEVQVNPEEIREDIFNASGHGGQNVQKNATAIRLTHLPTGLVVVCQDERSLNRNRQKAMAVLRARLLDRERHRQERERAQARRAQVGTAERAEKARTYNFPQNRVTDHRTDLTLHTLDRVLEGDLDPLIDAVALAEQVQQLQEFEL